jgi:hypothetical protein
MMAVSKLLVGVGLLAGVHHGWADYDAERAFTLEGSISKVEYGNPHVLIHVRPANDTARTWLAVLAPPSRMTRRGLPEDSVRVGQSARLYGYPHREVADEMRAERITMGERTTELR